MPTTQETDGFQVKRPGDVNVKCTLLLMLDHQVSPIFSMKTCLHGMTCFLFSNHPFLCYFSISQPPQYKLDPRLARLLGVHTQTRASIMQALWLYIKNNKLQDCHEKEFINCNRYFRQVMETCGGVAKQHKATSTLPSVALICFHIGCVIY